MKRALETETYASKVPRSDNSGCQLAVQIKLQELYALGLAPGDLDNRIIAELEALPEAIAIKCLDSLVSSDLTKIGNKSGFLKGIITTQKTKLATQQATGQALHPSIQAKLDELTATGLLAEGDIDQPILDSLAGFEPSIGLEMIDAFTARDLSTIRNKSGFLAGIMKRYRATASSPSQASAAHHHHHQQAPYGSQPQTPAAALPAALQAMGIPSSTANAVAALLPLMQGGSYPGAPGGYPQPPRGPSTQQYPAPRGGLRGEKGVLDHAVALRLETFYIAGLIGRDELDQRILDSLAQFAPEDGLAILDKLAETDLTSIMNKNGFLAGIMRRFRGSVTSNPAKSQEMQSSLSYGIQHALETLYNSGVVGRNELDAKALDMLRDMPESQAIDAVQRLQAADLSAIQNKSGFFVGIIKRSKQVASPSSPPQHLHYGAPAQTPAWAAAPNYGYPQMPAYSAYPNPYGY